MSESQSPEARGAAPAAPSGLSLVGWIGGLLAGLLVTVGAVIGIYQMTWAAEVYEKQQAPVSKLLIEQRQEEEKRLTSYGWVDKGRQIVRLPIAQAMKLVVEGEGPK